MIRLIGEKQNSSIWERYWTRKTPIETLISWVKENWGYKRLLKPFRFYGVKSSYELGAGKAYLSRILLARGISTYCIDSNRQVVDENKKFVDVYLAGDIFKGEPITDLVLSCGLIEHFKIRKLHKLAKKINTPYILMFFPSCDWKWKLLWKLRGITLTHYQHNEADLRKVFGKYKCSFGYINFFGLHYNYVYGVK